MRNKCKPKYLIICVFIIILVCSLCLDFCSCFSNSRISNNEDNYNDDLKLEGSGSVEDQFQLSNADDLYFFAKTVNEDKITYYNQNVALLSDIDLKDNEWEPIGVEKDYWAKT